MSAQTDGNKQRANELKRNFNLTDDDINAIIDEVDQDLKNISMDLFIDRNNKGDKTIEIAKYSKMGADASDAINEGGGGKGTALEEVAKTAIKTIEAATKVKGNISEYDALRSLDLKYSNQIGNALPLAVNILDNQLNKEKTQISMSIENLKQELSICAASE